MEASELFEIYHREDDSVQKKLTKKAIKLQKKYYKRRKIKEKYIHKKSLAKKLVSVVFDIALVGVALICGLVCFCNISSRMQNLPPSIGGYMAMQVVSGSMRASGFEIGDSVMIKSVDTDTLKEGDMIAFYVYAPSYQNFSQYRSTKIDPETTPDLKYEVSVSSFLGLQNAEVQEAAKMNSRRVFHQIIGVYQDKEGVRWFETKGTSNASKDRWWVKETLVIGAYSDTKIASVMSVVINTMTSSIGTIVVLMIPLVIVAMFIVGICMKDVYSSMLENEIVEEKRKLTDEICVKNKIGFNMNTKTKYKVLATAAPEDKMKYIELLWKDGNTPNAMKKYYLRKRMLIKPLEEKNALHRECEKLFEAGENPREIAKYFEEQEQKIEAKYARMKDKLKVIKEAHEESFEAVEENCKKKKKENKKLKNQTEKVGDIKLESEVKTTSELTKETGGKAKVKSTVNKKSTAKDSSSKGKSVAKKPVSKPNTAKKANAKKVSKK